MILAALGPVGVAIAIFVGTLFPPKRLSTTKAQREAIAARSQEFRAGLPVVGVLLALMLTVGALHLFAGRTDTFVLELR